MTFGGKPRNKAEQARFDAMSDIACLACQQLGLTQSDIEGITVLPTRHHLLSGGRRIGHMASICLCRWHHLGELRFGMTTSEMTQEYGPSLAKGSVPFRRQFGTDAELLEHQNLLLGEIV